MQYIDPIDFALPIFAVMIALEAWYSLRRNKHAYELKDTWTNIALGVVSVAFGILFAYILYYFYSWLYDLAPYKIPMNTWWPWVILILVDDLIYYWFHRLSHKSRFFWNLHVVHHSSEHFNLSVAVRQSWFSNGVNWIFYIFLGFLGFPLWAFIFVHGANLTYQYWIHTAFVKNTGPFEYFMNTPSHHSVHHAVNDIYIDKNFGGTFIVWDRMFGTFQRETEEPRYGITKPIKSFNWIWINTHAWFEMVEAMKERKTLLGKLRCIFASPNMDFVESPERLEYEK
jgi:alkylglycerol monooxygenase